MGMFNNMPVMNQGVFWTTIESRDGWELQQHNITGHYRIVDPKDYRQWSGTSIYTAQTMFEKLA